MRGIPSTTSRWLSFPSVRAVESAWTIVLAFAFWSLIVLICITAMATASAKGNPFLDFFVAFGAIGQVFFAFMVWRLGTRQFEHMRRVTERQARIDTYEHRARVFDQFVERRRNLYIKNIDDPGVWEMGQLGFEIRRFFRRHVVELYEQLIDSAWRLAEIQEALTEALTAKDDDEIDRLRKERTPVNAKVRDLSNRLYVALSEELVIEPEQD